MKPIANYDKIKAAGSFEKLPAGGYVARIIKAEDNSKKEYLHVVFDIAEGEYAGFFKDTDADRVWLHDFYQGYRQKEQTDKDKVVNRLFKLFTNSLEASNAGYKWDWNESALAGKLIGIVMGEEEYDNDRGETKIGLKVRGIKTAEEIREGKFKVPELKKLEVVQQSNPLAGFTPLNDDGVPF